MGSDLDKNGFTLFVFQICRRRWTTDLWDPLGWTHSRWSPSAVFEISKKQTCRRTFLTLPPLSFLPFWFSFPCWWFSKRRRPHSCSANFLVTFPKFPNNRRLAAGDIGLYSVYNKHGIAASLLGSAAHACSKLTRKFRLFFK